MQSLKDLDLASRRVFIRVDFNVPLEEGKITDDSRIRAALPTIEHALAQDARVILASHLGRPKGKVNPAFSLEPVGAHLAALLQDGEVMLAEDVIGPSAKSVVESLRDGKVALLENLRFEAGEETDDADLARELSRFADVYVNDAFGAAHRAHASVSALPKRMRHKACGLLLESELSALGQVREGAKRPYVAVLGGAKVSDKIGVIEALLGKVDTLIIGGAMANTLLAAQGKGLGKSLVEQDKLALARTLLSKAESAGVKLCLPTDVRVASSLDAAAAEVVSVDAIGAAQMALDIGPATEAAFESALKGAATVFWNGPMGLFERAPFAGGTLAMARTLAACPGFTVVGGGDSVAAVRQSGLDRSFDHVSTGGGASLEYLEGRKLPGVEALQA
ncbi:MAG: phosphoglycerate kinase [Polyangiales bacterium]